MQVVGQRTISLWGNRTRIVSPFASVEPTSVIQTRPEIGFTHISPRLIATENGAENETNASWQHQNQELSDLFYSSNKEKELGDFSATGGTGTYPRSLLASAFQDFHCQLQ